MNKTDLEIPESTWQNLYRWGGAAALTIAVIYLIEIGIIVSTGLPPDSVPAWFALLQANRALGILKSFSLDILATALFIPLFLAVSAALRKSTKSLPALILALMLVTVGTAVYFASNITFAMLSLSDQYAAAATDAQRAEIMAAGQALLAVFNGTGPFMAFTLNAVAGILLSASMLRSRVFSRTSAWLGILGNALELGPPPGLAPAFFLKIDPFLIGIGGVLLIGWYLLICWRLFGLAMGEKRAPL